MDVIAMTFPTYTLTSWDLSELLPEPSEEVFASRFAGLESAVASFEERRAELDPQMDPRAFLSLLRQYEQLHENIQVINGYASLWFYSDTGSQEALTFRNRVRQAATAIGNRTLFFTLWWRGLSDDEAWRLLPSESEHRDYRQYLYGLLRKPGEENVFKTAGKPNNRLFRIPRGKDLKIGVLQNLRNEFQEGKVVFDEKNGFPNSLYFLNHKPPSV